MKFKSAALLILALTCMSAQKSNSAAVQTEILAQTTSAWDGTPYTAYPARQPQISIVRITIPPNSTMSWHSHPLINAAYVLSGDLTVEKKDGTKRHFVAGQAIAEAVNVAHRGITGKEPAVLIVFYAGAPGLPLSK